MTHNQNLSSNLLSTKDFDIFSSLCYHAYVYHLILLELFYIDNNDPNDIECLSNGQYNYLFLHIKYSIYESMVMRISALHDAATTSKKQSNISVNLIYEKGGWDEAKKCRLSNIKNEMESYAKKIKQIRNKLLAHADRDTLLSSESDDDFKNKFSICPDIDGKEYFKNLFHFCRDVMSENQYASLHQKINYADKMAKYETNTLLKDLNSSNYNTANGIRDFIVPW